jgi:hypothetical protein
MKISELKRISSYRTAGNWSVKNWNVEVNDDEIIHVCSARSDYDTDFIAMASNHIDALLEIAELVREHVRWGHESYCKFYDSHQCICGVSDFEAALNKLEGIR